MTARIRRTLIDRVQGRHADTEQGSLILDILIGMALFALIAIIAISAIGQYRMRAYVQTAVSDATQTANAVSAFITDEATSPSGDYPDGFPIGVLTETDLQAIAVTPTSSGTEASLIDVQPGLVRVEDFSVCVEYRGAYALYDTAQGGLVESGDLSKSDFEGCGAEAVAGIDPYCVFGEGGGPAVMPRYDAAVHGSVPQLAGAGLADGEYFFPWDYFTHDEWREQWAVLYDDEDYEDTAVWNLHYSYYPLTASIDPHSFFRVDGYAGYAWDYGMEDEVGVTINSLGVMMKDGRIFTTGDMDCRFVDPALL